jgi:hypothetical protein
MKEAADSLHTCMHIYIHIQCSYRVIYEETAQNIAKHAFTKTKAMTYV